MRLFGRLEELVNIVMRSITGNNVTVRPGNDTASTQNVIIDLPPTNQNTELVDTTSTQTISNKELDAATTTISGTLNHGDHIDNPTSNVHGVTGNVVGTTDSQTLTNKTISGLTNSIINLQHGTQVDSPSSGVHGVTGDIVGTTDTQTLTNKIQGDQIRGTEITTPATPAAGTRLLYPKSTGWFQLDSAGIESQIQSSAPSITTIAGLDDTNITSPVLGQKLEYNGTAWTNVASKFTGVSSFIDNFATSGPSFTEVTGSTVSGINAIGSFYTVSLAARGVLSSSLMQVLNTAGGSFVGATVVLLRVDTTNPFDTGTIVARHRIENPISGAERLLSSSISFVDNPSLGQYSYSLAVSTDSSQIAFTLTGCSLVVEEL